MRVERHLLSVVVLVRDTCNCYIIYHYKYNAVGRGGWRRVTNSPIPPQTEYVGGGIAYECRNATQISGLDWLVDFERTHAGTIK